MDDACTYRMSTQLDSDLAVLSTSALGELKRAIRAIVEARSIDANEAVTHSLWTWGVSLATLAHDVARSVHILATHDGIRAAMVLNRCLSEYRVRLDYYVENPDFAAADLAQFDDELRKVLQSRPIDHLETYLSTCQMQRVRDFVSEPNERISRRNVKGMFEDIFGDRAGAVYGVHYAIASAFTHGSVLATGDVFRKSGSLDPTNYTFHFTTNVFSLNSVLGEALIHVLAILRAMNRLFGLANDAEPIASAFAPILARIEPTL
jgi:hypothetical protein